MCNFSCKDPYEAPYEEQHKHMTRHKTYGNLLKQDMGKPTNQTRRSQTNHDPSLFVVGFLSVSFLSVFLSFVLSLSVLLLLFRFEVFCILYICVAHIHSTSVLWFIPS